MTSPKTPITSLPDNCPVPVARPYLRPLLIALGFTCVGLGAVGVVVPGMPTTVFLIMAAWAFARSSQRFHTWLYSRPRFGPLLINWEQHRVIPMRAKVIAVGCMTLSFVYVAGFVAQDWVLPATLLAVMVPAAIYILTRASRVPNSELA